MQVIQSCHSGAASAYPPPLNTHHLLALNESPQLHFTPERTLLSLHWQPPHCSSWPPQTWLLTQLALFTRLFESPPRPFPHLTSHLLETARCSPSEQRREKREVQLHKEPLRLFKQVVEILEDLRMTRVSTYGCLQTYWSDHWPFIVYFFTDVPSCFTFQVSLPSCLSLIFIALNPL